MSHFHSFHSNKEYKANLKNMLFCYLQAQYYEAGSFERKIAWFSSCSFTFMEFYQLKHLFHISMNANYKF